MSNKFCLFPTPKKIIHKHNNHIQIFFFSQKKHVLVKFIFIMALWLIIANTTACQKRPENIVIISIDALNQSALNTYNPQAPNLPTLDLFSKQSVIFNRAYSSASWTLPAHASLFTGRYPDRHGAVHQRLKLSNKIPTLATQLKQAGFDTIAFTDGGYISRAFGFARGFDCYDDWVNPTIAWNRAGIPRNGKRNQIAGLNLFDRGIEYINGRKNSDKSFFLFLHTYVVHDYFRLHPWAVSRLPQYPDKPVIHYLAGITGKKICPQEDWNRLKSLYEAELYRMDEGFCRLLDALDKKGLRNSTLIIFLSDHGEGFEPEKGRIHHGGRLHQDLIRIPILISGPGIQPSNSNTPISLVDIMPTVLDLCNVPISPELDGKSLKSVLYGEEDVHSRPIYAMEHFHWWDLGQRFDLPLPQDKPLSIAVILGEDWYIRDRKGVEIYNMNNDPLQTHNLVNEPSILSELSRLAEMRNIYKPSAPEATLNQEVIDQLRSLGYIN